MTNMPIMSINTPPSAMPLRISAIEVAVGEVLDWPDRKMEKSIPAKVMLLLLEMLSSISFELFLSAKLLFVLTFHLHQ